MMPRQQTRITFLEEGELRLTLDVTFSVLQDPDGVPESVTDLDWTILEFQNLRDESESVAFEPLQTASEATTNECLRLIFGALMRRDHTILKDIRERCLLHARDAWKQQQP